MKKRLADGRVVNLTQDELREREAERQDTLKQVRRNLHREVKQEANRRITEQFPEWKQRNMMADMLELIEKGKDNWTQLEENRVVEYRRVWAWIKTVRDASDRIEEDLEQVDDDHLQDFDAPKSRKWVGSY